ncbi:MAG: glycine cleavage system protein GcvH [Chitinivibrionales bacterium]|nr:glycine cleavage system protein GcvH [Chitinivibrionales bacterium]
MVPNDRKYSESHEWIKVDGTTATVGITDYAQESLGDITFVELPAVNKTVKKGQECCVIESVKAASDIFSPVSGTISAVNKTLEGSPEALNKSPYENGWIFKLTNVNAADLKPLMDGQSYQKFLEEHQ